MLSESTGNAAVAYEAAISESGTACRFVASDSTVMLPSPSRAAMMVSRSAVTDPIASAKERGIESRITSQSTCGDGTTRRGKSRSPASTGIWINRCANAPATTPIPMPGSPYKGYRSAVPVMMPRL